MEIIKILREPKICNIAIFDIVATFIVAWLISIKLCIHPLKMFIFLMLFAICIHYYFGIHTMLNYYLGLSTYEQVMKLRESL